MTIYPTTRIVRPWPTTTPRTLTVILPAPGEGEPHPGATLVQTPSWCRVVQLRILLPLADGSPMLIGRATEEGVLGADVVDPVDPPAGTELLPVIPYRDETRAIYLWACPPITLAATFAPAAATLYPLTEAPHGVEVW